MRLSDMTCHHSTFVIDGRVWSYIYPVWNPVGAPSMGICKLLGFVEPDGTLRAFGPGNRTEQFPLETEVQAVRLVTEVKHA